MATLVWLFAATDIPTTQGTQGPACLPMDRIQRPILRPFVPGLLLTRTTGQRVPIGKEQETLLTSLQLSSLCPLLSPSYPSRFSSPPGPGRRNLVKGPQPELRIGDWSPPLGRELEFSGLVSGRAEFQSSLLWKPREKSRNAWVSAGGRRRL